MTDWQSELESLMAAVLDGAASEPEIERLEKLLTGNPDAQAKYLEMMSVHAMLRWRGGTASQSPSPRMADGSTPTLSPAPLMGEGRGEGLPTAHHPLPSAARSPVLGFLGGVMDYVSRSRMLMFWLMAAALGLYFTIQLGSLLFSRFWAQGGAQVAQNDGAGTVKHGPRSEQPGATNGRIVAHLTDAVDCRWEIADASGSAGSSPRNSLQLLPLGADFHAGQKLNLVAGLAELTFDSGAKVILHGPARFDVADAMGGHLQVGKLAAKVPHTAAGFTIATPGGKVVDLGTEFGVKVGDDGATEVIVYVGEVKIESGSGGDSGADGPKVAHVKAGEAVTVGPDRVVKAIPPENERFVRELTPLGDPAKAEAAYVEFMKSLKPVVWFRMEGKETDRTLHREMGGQDAKLYWDGPGNPFVKGQIGKGLWLRGEKLKDCAILNDYPKADHGKLSVVAWAYAESQQPYATIAANWRSNATQPIGQFEFGLGEPANPSLSVFFLDAKGGYHIAVEDLSHPFPLYSWQHVAFTTDGATMRVYRQGREVASTKHNGLLFPSPGRTLGIGAKSCDDPLEKAGNMMWWDGKLDEVAVFNDALSADDIRKLAAAAPR